MATPANGLKISDLFNGSWDLLKGFKKQFWMAAILFIALLVAKKVFVYYVPTGLANFVGSYIYQIIVLPITTGLMMMTLVWIRTRVADYRIAYHCYRYILPLTLYLILFSVIIFCLTFPFAVLYFVMANKSVWGSYVVLSLGGILFFAITLLLMNSPILIVDKKLSVINAFLTSIKVTARHIVKVGVVLLLIFIILVLSSIPLFIPLIWTLPYTGIIYSKMYIKLFDSPEGLVK